MARSRAAAGSAVVEVVFQASSFIGILAHGMAVYALVILAQETVGSQSVTGSAFATLYAPMVVLTMIGGALADRTSRVRLLAAASLAVAGVVLAMAAALALAVAAIPLLYGFAAAYGSALALVPAARYAAIAHLVPPGRAGVATAELNVIGVVAFGAGPSVVGWLKPALSWAQLFGCVAALWVVSALLGLWLVGRSTGDAAAAPAAAGGLRAGLAAVVRDPVQRQIYLLLAVLALCLLGPYQVLLPEYLRDRLELGELERGLFLGALGPALLAGGVLALWLPRRVSRGTLILGAVVLAAGSFHGLAWVKSAPLALFVFAVMGFAAGLAATLIPATLQDRADPLFRGRTMGVYAAIQTGMPAVGAAIVGLVADHAGTPATLALAGGVALIATLAAVLRFSALRRTA